MKKIRFNALLLVVAATLFSTVGCSSDDDRSDNNQVIICPVDNSSRAVFNGSRDMSYVFFTNVNGTVTEGENFMISPLSLTEVLTMLANGSDGDTKAQIMNIMGIGSLDNTSASQAIHTLNDFLTSADRKSQVAIANSQWIDNTFTVKDDFLKTNEELLNAETYRKELSSVNTMNDINSWCDAKTYGCIKKLFDEPLPAGSRMVLINALYFKGLWKQKFAKGDTKEDYFTNFDGSRTMVDMMHQTGEFSAYVDDRFDVAEIPYGNGSFCMDVILPHEGESLDECLKTLDREKMDVCLQAMGTYNVILSMPRMELKYRRLLNSDLGVLGMKDAFNPERADFSRMSDGKLYISRVEQMTSLKIDEEGTVAAAVTYSEMFTEAGPTSTLTFNMNRPFAFMIREKQTGVILFIGRMVNFNS